MTDRISIRLLGGFTVEADGSTVPEGAWRLRKGKTLVKLLALAPGHRLHRDRIAELVWPDRDRDAAANNFHQALHAARRALGSIGLDAAKCLELRDETLLLGPADAVEVDIERFEAAAEEARHSGTPAAYRTALELGTGELLPEDAYEDWAAPRRAAARSLRLALLVELGDLLAAARETAGAIEALQRAVVEEPLHEVAHRRLMRLLAADGRRQEALAQYAALKAALDRELAAEPDPETRELYRALLSGNIEAPDLAPPDTAAPAIAEPEPESAAAGTINLPLALTSFIGREREREEVSRMLDRCRLVTLTGPGGCGKTRLSLEVAGLRAAPRDGTWLVELAALSDPAAVAEAVASALDVHAEGAGGPLDMLAEQLRAREVLIVLDNCEHVVAACAALAERLLRASPGLHILATSREPLRVAGELTWRVPSLSLPAADSPSDERFESEAVQLFLARARERAPHFAVTPESAPAVAELCRRLDGMPLAIELAAARITVLSPAQIVERLGASLDVLGAGVRGTTRQETLRATLGWSHDLLTTEERVLLRRLSVFAGSFDVAAVEEVCGGAGLGPVPVLELLGRLADKSLVIVRERAGGYRYRLLETVRQFAAEHLVGTGEEPGLRRRHLEHFLRRAERDAGHPEQLEADHANLSAALAYAMRPPTGAEALRLASVLCQYWMARGHFAEGGRWLDAVLEVRDAPGELRARLLLDACAVDIRRGRTERLIGTARQGLAEWRALGDGAGTAQARAELAVMEWVSSEYDDAEHHARETLELADETPHAPAAAVAEHLFGAIAVSRGAFDDAAAHFARTVERLDALGPDAGAFFPAYTLGYCVTGEGPSWRPRLRFEETLVLFRRVDARSAAAYALVNGGLVARMAGDEDTPRRLLGEALHRFETARDEAGRSVAVNALGHAARQRGDFDAAGALLEDSLALRRRLGDVRAIAIGLGGLGLLALSRRDAPEARRRFGEAHDVFSRTEDVPALAVSALHRGLVELDLGDPADARPLFEESLMAIRSQRILRGLGWTYLLAAEAAEACGDEVAAAESVREAEREFARVGDRHGLAVAGEQAVQMAR